MGIADKIAAKGIVKWQTRWLTLEEARKIVPTCLSDADALRAAGVPSIDLAGKEMCVEDLPGAIFNPSGEVSNILVTQGLADIVKNIGFGLSAVTGFKSIAVGSSTTPVATGDTTLTAELTTNGWARGAATVTAQTTTLTGDTLQLIYVFTLSGTPGSVEEIGIFNNSTSGGDMLTHALTGTITLPAGAVVTFTYKVKFASA